MNRIGTKLLALTVALTAATLLAQTEYFADAVNGNDAWDGTAATHEEGTNHGPKKTLGEAVALADGKGTVITVAPGTYDQGEYFDEETGLTNRVVIAQPHVEIRSTEGKEKTFIVGKHSTQNWRGYGTDTIRCIYIKPNMLTGLSGDKLATNIVIRGFTIRNGGTPDANGKNCGGVFCSSPDGGSAATLVDCTVADCIGFNGGGTYRVNAIRTLFTGCHASNAGAAAYQGAFECCIFAFNYGTYAIATPRLAVNCTFAYNEQYVFNGGYALNAYNCLSFGNGTGNGMSGNYVNIYDSVFAEPTAVASATDSITDASEFQCLSPATQDWRLLTGSPAIGKGQGKWFTEKFVLPVGETHKDFLGNPIDVTGTVHCGAVQAAPVTPVGGRVRFNAKGQGFLTPCYFIEGAGVMAGHGAYHYGTEWPSALRIKYDTASNRYGFPLFYTWWNDGDEKVLRRPDYSGYVSVVPPPTTDAELLVNTIVADKVRYADAVNGNNSWDGQSATYEGGTRGPKKTLQAVANLEFTDHMIVQVAPGVYNEGGESNAGIKTRLYPKNKDIGFVATEGPGTAVLVGAADPDTQALGPNATRCFGAGGSTKDVFLQGIDLTGGYTAGSGDPAGRGGAAYFGNNANTLICDCTVSNCAADVTDVFYGQALRVKFLNNAAQSSETVRFMKLYSCLFAGNTTQASGSGTVGANCNCWGCTVVAPEGLKTYTQPGSCYFFGCLFSPATQTTLSNGSKSDVFADDPRLVQPETGNCNVRLDSPAIGGILADDYAATTKNAWRRLQDDIAGKPFVWTNGKAIAGASQTVVGEWYVDGTNGSDANDGTSPERAKKTIYGATAKAASGDVIRVAPGTYGDEETVQFHTTKVDDDFGPDAVGSRVLVPNGVTLVSTEGPEKTIILGKKATNPDANGNGTDAVRCVFLDGKAAKISGFTLTDGHTGVGTTARDCYQGAAVLSHYGLVENCIISNNFASRCAVGSFTTFVNCRIFGNGVSVRASAGRFCSFLQCVFDRNLDKTGEEMIQYFDRVENCTFGPNNKVESGAISSAAAQENKNSTFNNNLVLTRVNTELTRVRNCAFVTGRSMPAEDKRVNCVVADEADLALDAGYRPVVGANAAIDRGDVSLLGAELADGKDLGGNPRVMNGRMDIGAYEADWCATYAQDLGGKRLTVTEASSEVYENELHGPVRIPSGAIALRLEEKSLDDLDFTLSFKVTGNGTLKVFVNGAAYREYRAGTFDEKIAVGGSAADVRLEYVPGEEDAGWAELTRCRLDIGFIMIIK